MKLTIHRGTHEIGGCVTEIESNGFRVFIDFGEQLPGAPANALNPITGLTSGDVFRSALFITHYHGDHIGKICDANPELPIYAGEAASEIFKLLESRLSHNPDPVESEKHKQIVERVKTIRTFNALQQIKVGEICVTPLLVDHSAFDTYMFIVEAENIRILHTGDFRGHGFRSKGLLPTLRKYATDINFIISEGPNISKPDAKLKSEHQLQKDFEGYFRKYKYNFVYVSSTNIDRLFSLYHAAKAAQRCFICDEYQAGIIRYVSSSHKKFTSFYDIDFDQESNPAGRFFDLNRRGNAPLAVDGKLKSYLDKYGFCMPVRSTELFKSLTDEYHKSDESKVYYSMWNGYLVNTKAAFNKSLYDFIIPYNPVYLRTSGHPDAETLAAVFDTVKPKQGIIPIHTEHPEEFKKEFPDYPVVLLNDKEVYEVRGV